MDPRPPVPVARLAVEIADEAATNDIESFCPKRPDGWYVTTPREGHTDEARWVGRAVRYLTMRRKLTVRVDEPHLVKIKTTHNA